MPIALAFDFEGKCYYFLLEETDWELASEVFSLAFSSNEI